MTHNPDDPDDSWRTRAAQAFEYLESGLESVIFVGAWLIARLAKLNNALQDGPQESVLYQPPSSRTTKVPRHSDAAHRLLYASVGLLVLGVVPGVVVGWSLGDVGGSPLVLLRHVAGSTLIGGSLIVLVSGVIKISRQSVRRHRTRSQLAPRGENLIRDRGMPVAWFALIVVGVWLISARRPPLVLAWEAVIAPFEAHPTMAFFSTGTLIVLLAGWWTRKRPTHYVPVVIVVIAVISMLAVVMIGAEHIWALIKMIPTISPEEVKPGCDIVGATPTQDCESEPRIANWVQSLDDSMGVPLPGLPFWAGTMFFLMIFMGVKSGLSVTVDRLSAGDHVDPEHAWILLGGVLTGGVLILPSPVLLEAASTYVGAPIGHWTAAVLVFTLTVGLSFVYPIYRTVVHAVIYD